MLLHTFGGVSGIDERFSRLTSIKGHQGPPAGKYWSKTKPNIILIEEKSNKYRCRHKILEHNQLNDGGQVLSPLSQPLSTAAHVQKFNDDINVIRLLLYFFDVFTNVVFSYFINIKLQPYKIV
jgi:hypothetical protein